MSKNFFPCQYQDPPKLASQVQSQSISTTRIAVKLTCLQVNQTFFLHFFNLKLKPSVLVFLNVENIGVEPMTSCLQSRRSSQLS